MATKKEQLRIFDDQQIRSHWDSDAEMWFFSVIDVIAVLTNSTTPKRYWSDLKRKLKQDNLCHHQKPSHLSYG